MTGENKASILNLSSSWIDAPDSARNMTSWLGLITSSVMCLSLSVDRFSDGMGICFLKSSSSGNVGGGDSWVVLEVTGVTVLSTCKINGKIVSLTFLQKKSSFTSVDLTNKVHSGLYWVQKSLDK